MHSSSLLTIIGVLLFIFLLLYRIQALHKKKIWNLSIQQIAYLILIPGIVFPTVFSYLQSMLRLPKSETAIFSDGLLVNVILLTMMFSYGGIAMHAVTKMFSEYLRKDNGELAQINKFFHLTFSHNLIYSGIIVSSLGITLLEINHIPNDGTNSLFWGIVRGIVLGVSFATFIYYYTRASSDSYKGKWSDLKLFFGIVWIGFSLLLFVIQKFNITLTEYQLLIPMLLSFSFVVVLSLILVIRRLKNGGFRIELTTKIKRLFTKRLF